ncbi:unnamed protein product, partial [Acidocella sp. C78]
VRRTSSVCATVAHTIPGRTFRISLRCMSASGFPCCGAPIRHLAEFHSVTMMFQ